MYQENNINRIPLVFKTDEGRNYLEFHVNGLLASMEYQIKGHQISDFKKLKIDKKLDKEAVGNALMERIMDYTHRSGYAVIATCPELRKFIKKRPRYQRLVAEEIAPLT
ncbi:N-acetyltransferase [Allomuricauda sp. M10]|uniref:N-acetyltransferase n=1 Tax=Allomuricauda sp. M10 TaxID=2683292 RepID=UPI001D196451|nr:N-acetyltransferase [Muricauda sp. M10]